MPAALCMAKLMCKSEIACGIIILGHLCELFRIYPSNPEYPQSFACQAYKAGLEAAQNQGSWELAWPLLGLPDPDRKEPSIASGTERVALATLAKEKKVFLEVANRTRPTPKKEGKPKEDD